MHGHGNDIEKNVVIKLEIRLLVGIEKKWKLERIPAFISTKNYKLRYLYFLSRRCMYNKMCIRHFDIIITML